MVKPMVQPMVRPFQRSSRFQLEIPHFAGWDGFQIQQAVAEVVTEDPVGTARFMETTHRPTQEGMVFEMCEM